jgi:PQQ-dependent catabolism-associated CXXCW motif protein
VGSAATSVRWVLACTCALTQLPATATDLPTSDAPTEAAAVAPDEPVDYWTGPINGPVPATITGGTVIGTAELKALLENTGIVLVEVSNAPRRPENLAPGAPWLPTPHPVIPGSLWIPGTGLGVIPPDVEAYFRDQLASATGNDLDRPIVIYCHERCWLSWNAAKRAIRLGYRRVYWYPDGIEGWRGAGLTTSVAEPTAP